MNIEMYIDALEFAKSLAVTRAQYNELLEIASEEHADEAVKFEAKELTENGFHEYLIFMMRLSNAGNEKE